MFLSDVGVQRRSFDKKAAKGLPILAILATVRKKANETIPGRENAGGEHSEGGGFFVVKQSASKENSQAGRK